MNVSSLICHSKKSELDHVCIGAISVFVGSFKLGGTMTFVCQKVIAGVWTVAWTGGPGEG